MINMNHVEARLKRFMSVSQLPYLSVRPKFGIGQKYRPKVLVSVSELKFFFPKLKLYFFKNFKKVQKISKNFKKFQKISCISAS